MNSPTSRRICAALALLVATSAAAEEPVADAPVEDVPVDAAPVEDVPADAPLAVVPAESEPVAPEPSSPRPLYRWGGIGVPLVSFTTTDGVGFGLGGEVFTRRRDRDFGYRDKLTVSTYVTANGRYTSNYFQYERRDVHVYFARLIYRLWSDMIYVGSGGADVSTVLPDARTRGNRVEGPSALLSAQIRIPRFPFRVWVQAYTRYSHVVPDAGGLLDDERPFGSAGGWYADASAGVALHEVDRWPLPHKGGQFQASVRGGFSTSDGATHPIVGVNLEAVGWWPLLGERMVLGGRVLFDKTWGHRPFWEQEWLGGLQRDELAYEQMLLGYGRTRTRGDGVLAVMVDLRTFLGRTRHPVADVAFTLDVFAESAFVFDGDRLGPHLPTVGLGPGILWQGATYLRPWVGWGWLRDGPGGERRPHPQFGLALVEPL